MEPTQRRKATTRVKKTGPNGNGRKVLSRISCFFFFSLSPLSRLSLALSVLQSPMISVTAEQVTVPLFGTLLPTSYSYLYTARDDHPAIP